MILYVRMVYKINYMNIYIKFEKNLIDSWIGLKKIEKLIWGDVMWDDRFCKV